jgi:hypothetical protein
MLDKEDFPDLLESARRKLEDTRATLLEDMKLKQDDLERFKEETLWQLNALSDRTIEIARMEENDVEARLAMDWAKTEAAIASWKGEMERCLDDESFIDVLVVAAFQRLLPDSGENSP